MFLGPIVRSLAFQFYIFINTRTLARAEGLLTQLVFEHSLRIRLKAESASEKSAVVAGRETPTTVGTPDTASIAESTAADSASDEESVITGTAVSREPSSSSRTAQSSVIKGKSKETRPNKEESDASKAKAEAKAKKNDNLIGKINNLVTTDLSNILDSRDFLMLGRTLARSLFTSADYLPLYSPLCPTADLLVYYLPLSGTRMEVCVTTYLSMTYKLI